jgi:hypothetical protein
VTSLIKSAFQNKYVKFISSVRLAVPLMLAFMAIIAAGTVIESRYGAPYAKLAVYGSSWFFALLSLLAGNVFLSTLSRYPWGRQHIGFVITHVGLLTLFFGAFATSRWGIDGILRIPGGQSSSEVVLPGLMIGYQFQDSPSLQKATFERSLYERSGSGLDSLNDALSQAFTVERYLPFARVEKSYTSGAGPDGPVGVSFIMKSQFFNVSEWLHSTDNPEMQLGPARLRLVVEEGPATAATEPSAFAAGRKPAAAAATAAGAGRADGVVAAKLPSAGAKSRSKAAGSSRGAHPEALVIRDAANRAELRRASIAELKKGLTVRGVRIALVRQFAHAVVAGNKLAEGEGGPPNPALELSVAKGGESRRDVLYAKFPDFSLNKQGNFGLALSYEAPIEAVPASAGEAGSVDASGPLPLGHPQVTGRPLAAAADASDSSPRGNTVEFHVYRQDPKFVRVVLIKSDKKVGERRLREGESYQTPWMGMTIFIGSIVVGSVPSVAATPVAVEQGDDLPPSALLIKPASGGESFWLGQGDSKEIEIGGRRAMVFFANETLQLPLELKLEKFTKADYPGTDTPMSYESLVRLRRDNSQHTISMNEPLKEAGYTLYQSSYILNPGETPVTLLSVNRDPGRPIKYGGSLILAIGIATFTFTRSRLNRKKRGVAA